MPFTRLISGTHNSSSPNRVYILCSGKQYGIIIGEALGASLGWSHGEHVNLFLGDGPEEGILRVEKADDADYTLNKMSQQSKAFKIQRANFPNVERVKHERDFCHFEIEGGGINIDLPDWCLPPKQSIVAPKATVKPPGQEPLSPGAKASAALTASEANGKVDLAKYLTNRGKKASKLAGGFYQVDGERVSFQEAVEIANRMRQTQNLPKFLVTEIER